MSERTCPRCGWTYTKVNRAITEGRRRFLRAYAAIESGGECDRYSPVLAALAAGTATSAQVVEIRPHLRHCTACRATVRELHISILRRAELWLPLGWLPARDPARTDLAEQLLRDGGEVVAGPVQPSWLGLVKQTAASWIQRAHSTDLATGIQLASNGGGGGRLGAVATILGFCVGSLGAGTVCVISGTVPTPWPARLGGTEVRKAEKRVPATGARRTTQVPARRFSTLPRAAPAPRAVQTDARVQSTSASTPSREARPRPARTQDAEFGFEQSSPTASESRPPPRPPATASSGHSASTTAERESDPEPAYTSDPVQEEFGP